MKIFSSTTYASTFVASQPHVRKPCAQDCHHETSMMLTWFLDAIVSHVGYKLPADVAAGGCISPYCKFQINSIPFGVWSFGANKLSVHYIGKSQFMLVNFRNHIQLPENCFKLDMGGYPIARTNCLYYFILIRFFTVSVSRMGR